MPTKDHHYMRHAISVARQGLGRVGSARPSVGCVLVKEGHVIAAARTGDGGAPHAEAAAVLQAKGQAKGATAYVTLEPCAHYGRTPPCAEALVNAGIKRCVIACYDPFPDVNGKGIEILQKAGIEVQSGLLEEEAAKTLEGFFSLVTRKRPFVTLKTATSKDGKIAAKLGEKTQITQALATRYTHLQRAQHDAILVGIGTVLVDDPLLTTRLPGLVHSIIRVVLDRDLRIPIDCNLTKTAAEQPLYVLHDLNAKESKVKDLESKGMRCFVYDGKILSALQILAEQGITRLMVEGGAKIHTSFIEAEICDRFLHFKSSDLIIGEKGLDALAGYDMHVFKKKLVRKEIRTFDKDILEVFEPCSQD